MPRIQFITSYATELATFKGGAEYDVDHETAKMVIGQGIAKPIDAKPIEKIEKKVKAKDEVVAVIPAK